jgi:hypothetical protein
MLCPIHPFRTHSDEFADYVTEYLNEDEPRFPDTQRRDSRNIGANAPGVRLCSPGAKDPFANWRRPLPKPLASSCCDYCFAFVQ